MGRDRGADGDSWEDVEGQGIFLLHGVLTEDHARDLVEWVVRADMSDRFDLLQILINSPGGDLDAAMTILDCLEWSGREIATTGMGVVASASLMILMAGDRGRRSVMRRCSLLSHRFASLQFRPLGHAELVARRRHEDWLHARMLEHYLRHTNLKTETEVLERLLRAVDTYIDPDEAVELGIVDRIVQGSPRRGRVPSRVAGVGGQR